MNGAKLSACLRVLTARHSNSNYPMKFLTNFLAILALAVAANAQQAGKLELNNGDHIAIVGSGLADRQQHHGWLEALIHKAYPDLELTVRNLGFAADEVNVHPRSDEVPTTEQFPEHKAGDDHAEGRRQAGRGDLSLGRGLRRECDPSLLGL